MFQIKCSRLFLCYLHEFDQFNEKSLILLLLCTGFYWEFVYFLFLLVLHENLLDSYRLSSISMSGYKNLFSVILRKIWVYATDFQESSMRHYKILCVWYKIG